MKVLTILFMCLSVLESQSLHAEESCTDVTNTECLERRISTEDYSQSELESAQFYYVGAGFNALLQYAESQGIDYFGARRVEQNLKNAITVSESARTLGWGKTESETFADLMTYISVQQGGLYQYQKRILNSMPEALQLAIPEEQRFEQSLHLSLSAISTQFLSAALTGSWPGIPFFPRINIGTDVITSSLWALIRNPRVTSRSLVIIRVIVGTSRIVGSFIAVVTGPLAVLVAAWCAFTDIQDYLNDLHEAYKDCCEQATRRGMNFRHCDDDYNDRIAEDLLALYLGCIFAPW